MKRRGKVGGVEIHCPSWCDGGIKSHRQALDELRDLDDACVHLSDELGWLLDDIRLSATQQLLRKGGAAWRLMLRRPEQGVTTIELETRRRTKGGGYDNVTLDLLSSEARTLAAQLLHFANMEDLGDH